ncbi:hypothetical protein E4H04_08300 [Candidatus Bathyarchaeota archaeon]|nr:MAG: hypothetical protein E4H04_08300 [Candidatus Bathyarchaeota archaeon]
MIIFSRRLLREGVIGLTLYNGFLDRPWLKDHEINVTLGEQFLRHAEYIAEVIGWEHVGVGSDLDGGLGREESPVEIDSGRYSQNSGRSPPLKSVTRFLVKIG